MAYIKTKPKAEDPKKPTKIRVAKTQADVDAANAMAKRLLLKNNQRVSSDPIAVSKIGDALPAFVDPSGKPYVGAPKKQLPLTVPSYIGADDIKSEQGVYWYVDPKTGDTVDVDPTVVQLPRFAQKKKETVVNALAKR